MPRIGSKDYSVEFNDSIYETEGWQSSRYVGKQLNGAQINRYTRGDDTFGTTPVIRNVSRNIYIGNSIIDLGEFSNDSTLVKFPSSSYILIDSYLTIEEDGTITQNNFDGSNLDSKRGFYRSFFDDFPEGGDFQVKVLDTTVDNFLLDNYKVYFNQGRLHKIAQFIPSSLFIVVNSQRVQGSVGTSSDLVTVVDGNYDGTGTIFRVFNNQYAATVTNGFGDFTTNNSHNNFFYALTSSMEASIENRYFISLTSGSTTNDENTPIIAITGSNAPVKIGTYGTCEFFTFRQIGVIDYVVGMKNFALEYPKWITLDTLDSYNPNGDILWCWIISKLNDSKPAILTNLYLSEQLPSSVGSLPFIIVPSNIHPYIKDNLLYFLSQAGINIGTQSPPRISRNNIDLT